MSVASDFVGKELPPSWTYRPVSTITNFSTGFTPPTSNENYYGNDFSWANISDLGGGKYISTTAKGISTTGKQLADEDPLPVGTLLFSFKLSVGLTAITAATMYTNEAIAAFPPSPYLDTNYGYYALPVFIPLEAATNIYGAPILNAERIKRARVPLPPLKTQRRIAEYLDRETGKIDETITRIDKVIELLEERQAVFIDSLLDSSDHANASIELIANLENGDRGPSYPKADEIKTEGVPFVNAGDINSGRVSIRESKYVSPEKYSSMGGAKLSSGDVVFCLRGSVGKTGIYEHYEGALASSLCSLRPDSTLISSEFLYLNLAGGRIQGEVQATLTGSAQPNYGADQLASLKIPLPDLEEQERIVDLVNNEKKQNKIMMSTADRIKKLLSERRSALIIAAVTGRIEV